MLLGITVAALAVLSPSAIAGYEPARFIFFTGFGIVAAFGIMEPVTRLIGGWRQAGLLFLAVGVVGLVVLFALPYEWFYEREGLRLRLNAEYTPLLTVFGLLAGLTGGGTRLLLYKVLAGLGGRGWRLLLFGPVTLGETRERERELMDQWWALVRLLIFAGAAIIGVFAFFFVLYVLGVYVISPILRYLL